MFNFIFSFEKLQFYPQDSYYIKWSGSTGKIRVLSAIGTVGLKTEKEEAEYM